MRILVLGGTGWLGRCAAVTAVERGHEVTCLSRGSSADAPDGTRHVVADRSRPDAYRAVAAMPWDAVIDIATQPGQVRGAVAALEGSADRYVFVSTASVYASDGVVGADEDAPTHPPLAADTFTSLEQYGAAKVACEQAVRSAFGVERSTIARAGLIGGPGDRTGRSGYWPWRFAHPAAADGAVLVPSEGQVTGLIDVRDLAAWVVHCVEDGVAGTFNAAAHALPLADHLAAAREVAAHAGTTIGATDAWLAAREVQPWMGPRSLPLWLAGTEYAGFAARSTARAEAAGLRARPLAKTLADVLAWEEGRDHPHGAGLSDDEERELLTAALAEP